MAHNLFGERFASLRQPAWHALGTVFQDPMTAVEAVGLANLNYKIEKSPLFINYNGVQVPTGEVALVREPTPDDNQPRILGSAGPDYGLLNNIDLAHILDANLTKIMPVETVGALGFGERIFFALNAGEDEIVPGENLKGYFLITDARTGRSALQIAFTPVRVVCQNTLVSGLSKATVSWSLMHSATLSDDVKSQTKIIAQLALAKEQTLSTMRKMATTTMVAAQVDDILKAAYPEPVMPKMVRMIKSLNEVGVILEAPEQISMDKKIKLAQELAGRVESYRDGARFLFTKFNDEFPNVANTAWAVVNAVVECADYREGRDSSPASALFGTRAEEKIQAFRKAAQLVGVN